MWYGLFVVWGVSKNHSVTRAKFGLQCLGDCLCDLSAASAWQSHTPHDVSTSDDGRCAIPDQRCGGHFIMTAMSSMFRHEDVRRGAMKQR